MNGFQPIECLVQGLVLLGEVEANEMVHGFPEEARAGHGPYADLLGQDLAELQIIVIAEGRDVHEDVIGALWLTELQPHVLQSLEEEVALVGVGRLQFVVVVLPEVQAGDDGLLQGRGGPYGQKIMDLFDPLGDCLRGDGVAQPLTGDGVGLGERTA